SPPGTPTETVVINGVSFLKQTGGDAAAGNKYDWVAYSTLKNNACISMDFMLHSLGAMYPPPPDFDKAAESAVFTQIMSTFAWLPAIATPIPPTAAPSVVPSPRINKLFMNDSINGWAIGNSYVLRTSNGGVTWYNFSMPGISAVKSAFFQNASKGWVMATLQDDPNKAALFRTTNGGSTWISYSVPFDDGFIQFLDDNNGFVMAGQPMGMQKHPIQIYQTTNSGATWTLKYATDPYQANNIPPFSGVKNGMAFRNTTTGWISGEIPTPNFVYIYRTDNGGVTWAQQPMSVPTGYETGYVVTTAPIFFGTYNAVLPVWFGSAAGQRDLYLYVTHDGGTTWARSYAFAQHSFDIDIVSAQDAFSWDAAGFFRVTHNSGSSWTQVTSNINFGDNIYDLDFVSTTTGWVLNRDLDGNSALYRTTNGGSTWTALFNNIPAQPMPDLTITAMRIELQNTSCLVTGDPMGVRVSIHNNGQTAAGSFVLRVNNLDQTVNGLGVGETTTLFFPTTTNPVTAFVDATSTVLESNENNNVRSEMVPVPTPPPPCVTSADFAQAVVNNLNTKNFDAAKSMMGQTFGMSFWQSEGNSYSPADAIQQLQTNYLGASTILVSDPSRDLNTLLGGLNPYSIMALDPSTSQALFVSGWGLDGKGEAILYVTKRPDGTYYFDRVLIAPTGFAAPATPTLTGPYAVVRVALTDVLNIRSGAGTSDPVVGSFAPDAINVMRTGPTASADNMTWVEVQNPSGGTGWVNSYYLTDYVSHDAFCADSRIPILLEQLKGSVNQLNGDMLAAIVSPSNGVNVHLWRNAPSNNFDTTAARNIYISSDVLNWGTGAGQGGPDPVMGTFSEVIQPKLLEVFNDPNLQTYCDALTQLPSYPNMWPYGSIRYYNLYKPGIPGIDLDFRSWLIGFEYINGEPYLHSMITIVWEP
ncbi:MAG TPA: CARDB domain-containing protein, partial [Anaerolineales bacterium]|nr:CARDB domain-containing protein [Anaerolineales bacterium]